MPLQSCLLNVDKKQKTPLRMRTYSSISSLPLSLSSFKLVSPSALTLGTPSTLSLPQKRPPGHFSLVGSFYSFRSPTTSEPPQLRLRSTHVTLISP
ncbi:Hypothetical predicted protein [Octopus vulgaris]|uniref:Uncharacterized protein n=1 Tax=Octopus vulgaris TaxID=6645 RepID=A0AA36C2F1_OCTVU|nr:Hypothetical predicted protein [Octopus vulgaris]